MSERPSHHRPKGGFVNPWPTAHRPNAVVSVLRWLLVERALGRRAADPPASAFARAEPSFDTPRAAPGALLVTWVGHSTFLLQIGGWNVLTDPVWSERASPVQWLGPKRIVPPGIAFDRLPPIDLVLVSHDHYDHLDRPTVERLARRFPEARWAAPLGVARWLDRRGVRRVHEHDWWDELRLAPEGDDGAREPLVLTCTTAQHFSGRGATNRDGTLWCGWAVRSAERAAYFVGDSGDFPLWAEIAARLGALDAVLMPVGAYDPRWFMRPVHVNPEEAVAAFLALRAHSAARDPVMVAMHWGTFKLTDEPLDEPPRRAREAWRRLALPDDRLVVLAHGETRRLHG